MWSQKTSVTLWRFSIGPCEGGVAQWGECMERLAFRTKQALGSWWVLALGWSDSGVNLWGSRPVLPTPFACGHLQLSWASRPLSIKHDGTNFKGHSEGYIKYSAAFRTVPGTQKGLSAIIIPSLYVTLLIFLYSRCIAYKQYRVGVCYFFSFAVYLCLFKNPALMYTW